MAELADLKTLATQVRRDIVRMVHGCQSGHPGGSLGCVEFMVALYGKVMHYDAANFDMDGKNEDLFFFPMVTFHRFGTAFWPAMAFSSFRIIDFPQIEYAPSGASYYS